MFSKDRTFYENIKEMAGIRKNAAAIFYEGRTISYKALLKLINKFSAFFTLIGLKKGDMITLVAPNTPEAVASYYAASQCGLKIHLLHPLTIQEIIIEHLDRDNSKLLITSDLFLNSYDKILKKGIRILTLDPTDSLNFIKRIAFSKLNKDKLSSYNEHKKELYTFAKSVKHLKMQDSYVKYDVKEGRIFLSSGGTTGISKTIVHDDYAFSSVLINDCWFMEYKKPETFYDKTMLAVLPMFHGFGLTMGIMALLAQGGRIALMPKFHTKPVVKLLQQKKLTYLIGVPAIYEALLHNKNFRGKILEPLRQCWVGGDFISPSLLERFNKRLEEGGSRGRLMEGYGLTETVTVLSVNRLADHKDGTIGRAIPGVEVAIVDDEHRRLPSDTIGTIAISGETLMLKYVNGGNPFFEMDGKKWIDSGDIGKMDKDGFITFISRKKRVIKKKGMNVYPLAIEKKASSLKEILECAYLGETYKGRDYTVLFVSLNKGYTFEQAEKSVNDALKTTFNSYELPDEIMIKDKFTHTNVGKINYIDLGKEFHNHLVEKYGK